MEYFQTRMYVSKIRRIPVIGRGICYAIQFLCGLTGHTISKTEWGYGGGDYADVWCRWCNKLMKIPLTTLKFQHKDMLTYIKQLEHKNEPYCFDCDRLITDCACRQDRRD